MRRLKYKWIMVLTFLLSIFLMDQANAYRASKELPLLQKVIYIDAGHGGRDPGTMFGNLYEKEINLQIAKKLEEVLGGKGAIVYMIREEDKDYSKETDQKKKRADLEKRIELIETAKSDLYLSIHINWYKDSYWNGAEVQYADVNPKNKMLADSIMKQFTKDLKSTRSVHQTDLYMYNHTKVPGVLIECGFFSNPKERELLQDPKYQKKISESIAKGVISYFEQVSKV